jgi:phosphohistidine phosphatase
MKSLYLLRHAKSSWSDAKLSDFDRPLNKRGKKAAPLMAAFMRQQGLRPEVTLCSTARRAEETWRLVAPTLGGEPKVRFLKSLYLAPPSVLLASLRRLPEIYERAMIVGHNPGLEHLAQQLCGGGKKAALAQLAEKFPTAALAVITFEDEWGELEAGKGYLEEMAIPADL